jgi:PAS domain S-box-containing protein
VISSTLLGLAYRYCRDKGWVKTGFTQFLIFGLLVQIVAVFFFIWFPDNIARDVMRNVAIPFIIIFTPATAFLGLLLLDTENRIKTDVALSVSEARLRSTFNAIPDVLFILDEDGRYLEILSSNMALLSAEKSKLIGRLMHDVLPQNVADMLLHMIKKTIDNQEQQTFEYERETLSGRRVFEARTQPFETPAGEKKAVVFLARDITAKREIEAALHESERKFRLQSQRLTEVIWGTNIGTWEWNVQTGRRTYNERWAEIVGYTLEELSPVSNHTWEKLTHPDDLKHSIELLERCFHREAQTYSCELRMRHKNGSWVWVLDRGRVVEWTTDGEPIRMSGTHQDITESKEAEARLQLAASVFTHAREGIVITDADGTIIPTTQIPPNKMPDVTCSTILLPRSKRTLKACSSESARRSAMSFMSSRNMWTF